MEQKKFLTWLLGIFAVGILCLLALGRPSPSESIPVKASYTQPPTVSGSSSGSGLASELSQIASSHVATVTPTTSAPVQESTPSPGITAITTAPGPAFDTRSVVGLPLREAVAKVAAGVPGAVIRPIPQGQTAPPGTYNSNRFSLTYDPNTLVVTQCTVG
jgi:hypothetical protein